MYFNFGWFGHNTKTKEFLVIDFCYGDRFLQSFLEFSEENIADIRPEISFFKVYFKGLIIQSKLFYKRKECSKGINFRAD